MPFPFGQEYSELSYENWLFCKCWTYNMATNTEKAKSKSKYTDVMIFLQKNLIWMQMSPSQFAQMYLGDLTLNVMSFTPNSSNPSETLHIHCCHLVDTIGITSRVMAGTGMFLLHFKDGGRKKVIIFFVFSSTRYVVFYSPTFNLHFHKLQKCFLSNGTKNMHILASGPELQAVRFGYVI